jgi:ketosteroid isomerase-like protein
MPHGASFKARFAHVWTMRDRVIVRLQACAETVHLAKALRQDFSDEQP